MVDYSIVEQSGLLVVSLDGILDTSSAITFEECGRRVEQMRARAIVLNMATVSEVGPGAVAALARFCHALRAHAYAFYIAGLCPTGKEALLSERVVWPDELRDTLSETLIEAKRFLRFLRE